MKDDHGVVANKGGKKVVERLIPVIRLGTAADHEPIYGMEDQQVIAALRQLAKKLGYTASPRLERTARAHMAILRELEIPVSLSERLIPVIRLGTAADHEPSGLIAAAQVCAQILQPPSTHFRLPHQRRVFPGLHHEAVRQEHRGL